MKFGLQEHNESWKDRTLEDKKKIMDILEMIGIKEILNTLGRTRKMGIYDRVGIGH